MKSEKMWRHLKENKQSSAERERAKLRRER